MRSAVWRVPLNRTMDGGCRFPRYFSDGKGKVFSEEEKAAENIYIKKMEKERMEKLKLQAEKEKVAAEKENSEKKN